MSEYKITMAMEQIDEIVVGELKWAYQRALSDFDEPLMIYGDIEENVKLIDGLETVLKYFLSDQDFNLYVSSDDMKELRKNYDKYITDRN